MLIILLHSCKMLQGFPISQCVSILPCLCIRCMLITPGLSDLFFSHEYVMCKPWIGTIHGLRCSKYGSVLCASNPWIAQHLHDPWIAQPHSVKRSVAEVVMFDSTLGRPAPAAAWTACHTATICSHHAYEQVAELSCHMPLGGVSPHGQFWRP